MIAILVIGYLLIGTFFAALADHVAGHDENSFMLFMVFILWPLVLGLLVFVGLFLIMIKLAEFIYEVFVYFFDEMIKRV